MAVLLLQTGPLAEASVFVTELCLSGRNPPVLDVSVGPPFPMLDMTLGCASYI